MLGDAQVKQVQSVVWSMAQEVIALCDDNGIPYMLDGGSCLGSLRHGGFIPWDDDMDISVLRRDYNRLVELLREELSDRYWVHTPEETQNYGLPMMQLRLKGTVLKGKDDFDSDECGVPLDIFVIENTFDALPLRMLHGFACTGAGFLQVCRKTAIYSSHFESLVANDQGALRNVRIRAALGRVFFWVSLDQATRFTMFVYSLCRDDESGYVSFPSGRGHFFGELNRRELLMPPSKGVFEGREVSLPHMPGEYMTSLFGDDYMSLPPEEKREHHAVLEINLGEGNKEA